MTMTMMIDDDNDNDDVNDDDNDDDDDDRWMGPRWSWRCGTLQGRRTMTGIKPSAIIIIVIIVIIDISTKKVVHFPQ